MSPGVLGIDDFLPHPAFRTYVACAAILALKMVVSAVYTAVQRGRHRGYANPEDARAFGPAGAAAAREDPPAVARALRIQRNDVENIPLFLVLALAYVLAGASPLGAAAYCWTFTLARIAHTVAYTWNLQPWRALCWGIGVLATVGIAVQLLLAAL
jgi:uncharacterized MAPEG superfamily protein